MSFTQEFRQKSLKVNNLDKEITSLKQEREKVKESLQEELDNLRQVKAEAEQYLPVKEEALSLYKDAEAEFKFAEKERFAAEEKSKTENKKIQKSHEELEKEKKEHFAFLLEMRVKIDALRDQKDSILKDYEDKIANIKAKKDEYENYLDAVKEEHRAMRDAVRNNKQNLLDLHQQYDVISKELEKKQKESIAVQKYLDENQDSAKKVINGIIEREHNLATREKDLKIKQARLQALYKKHFPNKQIKV